jgi:hypothetical protein
MRGAIPPFLQYASMAWCSVKAQGHLYLLLCLIDQGGYGRKWSRFILRYYHDFCTEQLERQIITKKLLPLGYE